MTDVLTALAATLDARRAADPEDSYVASLYARGLNRILEKIGEEATEVIIAAKDARDDESRDALISEVADLWFHCMVMLTHLDQSHETVLDKLGERFNVSGHEEKARRILHNAPPQSTDNE